MLAYLGFALLTTPGPNSQPHHSHCHCHCYCHCDCHGQGDLMPSRYRLNQLPGVRAGGMVENLLHRPLLNHRAMAQHKHSAGEVGDHRQVVRHQYVSPPSALQCSGGMADVPRHARCKCTNWLGVGDSDQKQTLEKV